MIRAVLDTNTIVSALLVPTSVPARILAVARAGNFELITSGVIKQEVQRTLQRPRIQFKYAISPARIEGLRILLDQRATSAEITREVHGVASHPQDDLVLATADSADADYLVTGDRQLQRINPYERVQIVSPRQAIPGHPGA